MSAVGIVIRRVVIVRSLVSVFGVLDLIYSRSESGVRDPSNPLAADGNGATRAPWNAHTSSTFVYAPTYVAV